MLLVKEKNKLKFTESFLSSIIKYPQNMQVRIRFYQKVRPFVVDDVFSSGKEKVAEDILQWGSELCVTLLGDYRNHSHLA